MKEKTNKATLTTSIGTGGHNNKPLNQFKITTVTLSAVEWLEIKYKANGCYLTRQDISFAKEMDKTTSSSKCKGPICQKRNMENGIKEYFKELGNNPINPLEIKNGNESMQFVGLTKREYFAGLAMQSLVVAEPKWRTEDIARFAIKISDDLLKELDKPKNEAQ